MKFSELNNGDVFSTNAGDYETIFIKTEPIKNELIYGNCIVLSSTNNHAFIHKGEVGYVSEHANVRRYKINELICVETTDK